MLVMGEINTINSKIKSCMKLIELFVIRTLFPLTPGLLLKALYFLHSLLVYSSREGKLLLYTQVV